MGIAEKRQRQYAERDRATQESVKAGEEEQRLRKEQLDREHERREKMSAWARQCEAADQNGEPRPPMPDDIPPETKAISAEEGRVPGALPQVDDIRHRPQDLATTAGRNAARDYARRILEQFGDEDEEVKLDPVPAAKPEDRAGPGHLAEQQARAVDTGDDGPEEDADASDDEPAEEERPRRTKRSKSKKHRRA